jgi:uncharacterized membrane protein YphA (DoxX/SURF4 family)
VHSSPGLIRRIDATGIPLLLARLGVGGMFAYLAYMKLRDPINFLKLTHEYGILPPDQPLFLNLAAVALPWLEMVCAVALLLGIGRRGAALLVTGMLLFFTPMLFLRAWGMYTAVGHPFTTFCAVKFDCGCGTGEVFICPKLAENVVLLLGALIALFSASRRFCLEGLFTRRRAAALLQPVPRPA